MAVFILFVAALATAVTGRYGAISSSDRRLVGLNAAADMLDVSRSKVHLLVQDNQFEVVRVGRRLLITVDSLDAYIERQRQEQAQ